MLVSWEDGAQPDVGGYGERDAALASSGTASRARPITIISAMVENVRLRTTELNDKAHSPPIDVRNPPISPLTISES